VTQAVEEVEEEERDGRGEEDKGSVQGAEKGQAPHREEYHLCGVEPQPPNKALLPERRVTPEGPPDRQREGENGQTQSRVRQDKDVELPDRLLVGTRLINEDTPLAGDPLLPVWWHQRHDS